MTKPSITTRAGKGSALTWTEGDTNLTNLRDATLTVKAGTGGTDVVSDLNGTVTLVAGTNVTITGDNTAKTVTIASSGGSATPAGSNQQIQYNNSGAFGASSGLTYDGVSLKVNGNLESTYQNGDEGGEVFLKNAATNTTITNGVTIDVYQNKLRFFENGGSGRGYYVDITSGGNSAGTNLAAGGSSTLDGLTDVVITAAATDDVLVYNGTNWVDSALSGLTVGTATVATGATNINISTSNGNNNDTTMYPVLVGASGTGNQLPHIDIGISYNASTDTLSASAFTGNFNGAIGGTTAAAGTFTSISTSGANGTVTLSPSKTASGGTVTISPSETVTISTTNGAITLTPGSGQLAKVNQLNYNEGPILDLGTTGGTIAPNAANGNVQKITLNSALTINAFTNPIAGQSVTLIIYGGTSYTSITSTMKFAGGIKTLTATAGCIDILSIYYDGTNYFASLGKGFA